MSNYTKQVKQIITWVLLALLVGLWIQFMLFPKHKQTDIQAVTAPPTPLQSNSQTPKLSSFHLFGSSTETEVPLDLLQGETSLDLIITGIFASNDPAQGRAYIRSRQGDEKKFQVGDDVFGLATLDAIHEDHLVLKRSNSRKEKLSLSKGYVINTNRSSTRKIPEKTDPTTQPSHISNHINTSSDWQDMLNKQKYDPNKIAKIVGNVSVVRNNEGKIAGLRVSSLSASNALTKQGLKRNDQIIAINGIDISASNVLTLQQQLQNNPTANVTVMRKGRKMNLNINLSEFQQ